MCIFDIPQSSPLAEPLSQIGSAHHTLRFKAKHHQILQRCKKKVHKRKWGGVPSVVGGPTKVTETAEPGPFGMFGDV